MGRGEGEKKGDTDTAVSRIQSTRSPRAYTRTIRAVYMACGGGGEEANEGKVKRKERKEDATIIHERTRRAKERQRRANGVRGARRRRTEHRDGETRRAREIGEET